MRPKHLFSTIFVQQKKPLLLTLLKPITYICHAGIEIQSLLGGG
jgi:hypothetical protein